MIPALAGLVSPHPLPEALLDQVHELLPRAAVAVPTTPGFHGVQFRAEIVAASGPGLRTELRALAEPHEVDASLVWGPLVTEGPGLLVMDVDSTLITAEVIELIADHAGVRELVADITERAMRGELDFTGSLIERVATLEGLPTTVFADVRAKIHLSPGARDLIEAVQRQGGHVGLVSGGFTEIIEPFAADLGVTLIAANRFEVVQDRLTGRTQGPVVNREAKARHLREYAASLGLGVDRAVAIGDGANDLDMIDVAALGIAYHAKPITRAAADAAISFPRLDAARVFIGV